MGGPYKGTVNPTVLKSLQLGAFSMKPSTSIMKGTPSFLRLEYQSTTTSQKKLSIEFAFRINKIKKKWV